MVNASCWRRLTGVLQGHVEVRAETGCEQHVGRSWYVLCVGSSVAELHLPDVGSVGNGQRYLYAEGCCLQGGSGAYWSVGTESDSGWVVGKRCQVRTSGLVIPPVKVAHPGMQVAGCVVGGQGCGEVLRCGLVSPWLEGWLAGVEGATCTPSSSSMRPKCSTSGDSAKTASTG